MPETEQQNAGSPDEATQGGEAARYFSWAEATVWTKRMPSALVNGVKGGKWYVSGASDMSGLGSTWFVRFLDRGITCCRRFGWRVFWMRSPRIVRDD